MAYRYSRGLSVSIYSLLQCLDHEGIRSHLLQRLEGLITLHLFPGSYLKQKLVAFQRIELHWVHDKSH